MPKSRVNMTVEQPPEHQGQPSAQPTELDPARAHHEGYITDTWYEQNEVENRIHSIREANGPRKPLVFLREKHVAWLRRNLHALPRGFHTYEALQGWAAFWILHSLDLLGATVPKEDAALVVRHLNTFKHPTGGYGGGPEQIPHLASTFASVMALCALGTDSALASIDKDGVERFLCEMKNDDGSFRVSEGGEVDVRAMYCAITLGSLLGILDGPNGNMLMKGCDNYLVSLQTFDGGLAGERGAEAHGGNTYCGLAAAVMVGTHKIDVERVLDWAVMRQMSYEGGFQGRTNKLVDACYSFWVGGLFPLLAMQCKHRNVAKLFNAKALERYVLECCQLGNGGLRDKPGVPRDLMHTCYALSGLSIAQHFGESGREDVKRVNPIYNLCDDKFERAWEWFRKSD